MPSFNHIVPALRNALAGTAPLQVTGRVTQVTGTIVRGAVPNSRIGEICILRNPLDGAETKAEVVGFSAGAALLAPIGDTRGLSSLTEIRPTGRPFMVPVGPGLLGRVVDGLGNALDSEEKGPLLTETEYPVQNDAPHPLRRRVITEPMALGIRAIDGLLTCGEGQRMGIFAAAGGGKSTLMGMLVNGSAADVTVVALIGERGREVGEFLQNEIGPDNLRKSVVVCATGDKSPMERVKAAFVATTIAEYFRDQGKRVMFLMDSVTRFARAQREIGLAAGEPPTRRGYPPSVFAGLPKLLERSGMNERGSITAFYTVLVEGDDMSEPIADEVRSILDGHIVLSRKLGAANHYPAIDVLASTSRVMRSVVSASHERAAGHMRQLLAKYQEIELLVNIGEYAAGTDAVADAAVRKIETINAFLRQPSAQRHGYAETVARMSEIVES
jgi:type III secretion protein N (ATPase)